jgi:hypothetical protein
MNPMGWADWMQVNLPLEDELMLEKQAREIRRNEDPCITAELCADLYKSAHIQNILLKQAVGRIIELEATLVSID